MIRAKENEHGIIVFQDPSCGVRVLRHDQLREWMSSNHSSIGDALLVLQLSRMIDQSTSTLYSQWETVGKQYFQVASNANFFVDAEHALHQRNNDIWNAIEKPPIDRASAGTHFSQPDHVPDWDPEQMVEFLSNRSNYDAPTLWQAIWCHLEQFRRFRDLIQGYAIDFLTDVWANLPDDIFSYYKIIARLAQRQCAGTLEGPYFLDLMQDIFTEKSDELPTAKLCLLADLSGFGGRSSA